MKATKLSLEIGHLPRPEQLLALIQNKRIRDLVGGLCMSHGVFPADNRPAWAIRAAGEFWRCCFGFSKGNRPRSELYQLGFAWGFAKHAAPQLERVRTEGHEQAIIDMMTAGQVGTMLYSAIDSASLADQAEFHAGLAEGLKTNTSLSPSSPFMVYLILTMMWREISPLKNTGQVHNWIENILGSNLTGQRDRIAKLLRKIGFPLTDKGGRPKGKPRKQLAK